MKILLVLLAVASVRGQSKFCPFLSESFPYSAAGSCGENSGEFCAEPKCPPNEINMIFTFYAPGSPNTGITFTRDQVPAGFVGSRQTVFIIHGWQTIVTPNGWLVQMKNNIHALNNDHNVIIVDWHDAGGNINYLFPASETRTVGAEVAYVIRNLISSGGLAGNRVHCIGHSLGSHVCGNAGKRVSGMGRISGMDPAGPAFTSKPTSEGLHPGAANFVDVLHTDSNLYGSKRPLGDADYYPADGNQQPGCVDLLDKEFDEITDLEWELYGDFLGCSHGRAVDYMSISIQNDCFKSRQSCTNHNNLPGSCSNCGFICGTMGFHSLSGQRGMFRLDVNPNTPFCQN